MPKLLQVAHLGHPILREKASAVKKIDTKFTQDLIDDMLHTVIDVNGVGMAAPQVYVGMRIFIMASRPNARYPYAPEMEPTAVINPKITGHSKKKVKDWEGCLSIPGIRALVTRWKWVDVEYKLRNGEKVTTRYEDFLARIFQHEYDHLEGKVFFDRVDSTKDIYTEKEFLKIIAERITK